MLNNRSMWPTSQKVKNVAWIFFFSRYGKLCVQGDSMKVAMKQK